MESPYVSGPLVKSSVGHPPRVVPEGESLQKRLDSCLRLQALEVDANFSLTHHLVLLHPRTDTVPVLPWMGR